MLKKCRGCEDGYYLFSSPEDFKDYCSVCPLNTFAKYVSTQEKPICSPKIIISGNLSTTADPRSFDFSFDEAWEEYFRDYKANFKIEITGKNITDYECNASKNTSMNYTYIIYCTYKINITEIDFLQIALLNIPPEDEFSERVIRVYDYRVSMKKYIYCPQNFSLNQGIFFNCIKFNR